MDGACAAGAHVPAAYNECTSREGPIIATATITTIDTALATAAPSLTVTLTVDASIDGATVSSAATTPSAAFAVNAAPGTDVGCNCPASNQTGSHGGRRGHAPTNCWRSCHVSHHRGGQSVWSTGSDLFAACTRHTTAVDDADGTIIAPPVTLAYAYATAHVPGGVANTTAAAAVAYGAQ